ncbi:MAG: hypothetical protein HDQ88_12210 [Clostridia bacterium]|nr:hypothetical protein [Clostridia bacterium]
MGLVIPLSSAVLQAIAIFTMFVDHVGYFLFPGVPFPRIIGRISYPLFVFLLVEGYAHTSNRVKYICRLLIFSVLCEAPYEFVMQGNLTGPYNQNVFFSHVLIFVVLWLVDVGVEKGSFVFFFVGIVACLAESLGFMYGGYGVLLGLCFYLFRDKRWVGMLSLMSLTVGYCWVHGNWLQLGAISSLVFLYLYNGRKGRRLPKYFGYVFYPLHLLLLYGVSQVG